MCLFCKLGVQALQQNYILKPWCWKQNGPISQLGNKVPVCLHNNSEALGHCREQTCASKKYSPNPFWEYSGIIGWFTTNPKFSFLPQSPFWQSKFSKFLGDNFETSCDSHVLYKFPTLPLGLSKPDKDKLLTNQHLGLLPTHLQTNHFPHYQILALQHNLSNSL